MCGHPHADHDRHLRFILPEPVLASELQDRAPGAWLSHETAARSVMMRIPPLGAFVRALLPVKLTGDMTITFGVWVAIHPQELQRACAVWWEPDYQDLRLEGYLANSVQPWGLLAAPVVLTVRDPDETPYCSESSDPHLLAVLTHTWPHPEILDALPRS
jgi:hypothetical protein